MVSLLISHLILERGSDHVLGVEPCVFQRRELSLPRGPWLYKVTELVGSRAANPFQPFPNCLLVSFLLPNHSLASHLQGFKYIYFKAAWIGSVGQQQSTQIKGSLDPKALPFINKGAFVTVESEPAWAPRKTLDPPSCCLQETGPVHGQHKPNPLSSPAPLGVSLL